MVKGNKMKQIKFILLIITVVVLTTGVVYAGTGVTPDGHIPGQYKL